MRLLPLLVLFSASAIATESDNPLRFDNQFGHQEEHPFHMHAGWDSRYVSEGRDNLDGDGILSGTLEASWKPLSLGLWYGNSPAADYDELHLSAALGWAWRDLEWYAGYSHLRFPIDGGHDHEVAAGFNWSALPVGLDLGVVAYYSFDADGAFGEATLGREFEISECFSLKPSIVFGINQGYVTDGHDGANHIALGAEGAYTFTEAFSAEFHASYNLAIDRDSQRHAGDELLRDFFHAGIGLRFDF